jgi:hypothetical protein
MTISFVSQSEPELVVRVDNIWAAPVAEAAGAAGSADAAGGAEAFEGCRGAWPEGTAGTTGGIESATCAGSCGCGHFLHRTSQVAVYSLVAALPEGFSSAYCSERAQCCYDISVVVAPQDLTPHM